MNQFKQFDILFCIDIYFCPVPVPATKFSCPKTKWTKGLTKGFHKFIIYKWTWSYHQCSCIVALKSRLKVAIMGDIVEEKCEITRKNEVHRKSCKLYRKNTKFTRKNAKLKEKVQFFRKKCKIFFKMWKNTQTVCKIKKNWSVYVALTYGGILLPSLVR